MIVMMIVMFLPVLAIAVFWFFPLGAAVGVYLFCLLLSGSLYWIMHNNMRRRVTTGVEALIGKETTVISRSDTDNLTPYMVRADGEIWCAGSPDSLKNGDLVIITAVRGNKLVIKLNNKKEDERR